MIDALLVLAVVVLVVLVLWWQVHDPAPSKPRRPHLDGDPFCAWCTWRDGDDCTNPASPVGGQECGPVCVGDLRCTVRELRRR